MNFKNHIPKYELFLFQINKTVPSKAIAEYQKTLQFLQQLQYYIVWVPYKNRMRS